jgi:lipopolysaccharide biosynthesis glycosyltransferase
VAALQWSLDSRFFLDKLKWTPNTNYFNAGVLILNVSKSKEENVARKIQKILGEYSNELVSHDQTLLNPVCEGEFFHWPCELNVPWYPGKLKPENSDNPIILLVGSPKPWNMFGMKVHAGYSTWNGCNTPFWKSNYGTISVNK